jgi:hypothetical protein
MERGQRGEGGDGHVITTISGLSAASVLCRVDDQGPGLAILILSTLLRMAIICFILGATPVLNVMAVALLAFHDAVDGARGAVLMVVLRAMS